VLVKLVGNDRHEVTLHLERDGFVLQEGDVGYVEGLPTVHRMTCDDKPLIWKFAVDLEVRKSLRCILTWVEPFGDAVRSQGFRRQLHGADIETAGFEEWYWYRFFRFRRRFESWAAQHGPMWFREKAGRPRRLGEWRPYRMRELQPGQSPFTSGALPPPDGRRRGRRGGGPFERRRLGPTRRRGAEGSRTVGGDATGGAIPRRAAAVAA
jgi:hypothetical protein